MRGTLRLLFGLLLCCPAWADGGAEADLKVAADTMWVLITAFLVFWMNAGFGCVEAGFCRAKNAVNILGKNFVVFALSSIAFWIVGFAIMFGDGNSFMGLTGWFLEGTDNSPVVGDAYKGVYSSIAWTGVPLLAKFFFQLVFAGTAATIVSGCVAERIHYRAYMIFTLVLVGLFYPISGHWIWGGGWLADLGFWDFAGSTVVHSVGGWAGLAGIILLGPRLGKYNPSGAVQPIPGHSMALAFLGGLILWLGWFGFNPGSTMAADPGAIAHIVVTTNLACTAGLLAATVVAWIWLGKPDFGMTINGALAGLVAITADPLSPSALGAAFIGAIGGLIVVVSIVSLDKLKLDDPVGAISVHGVVGIWGVLAVPLSNDGASFGAQIIGIAGIFAWVFLASLVVWLILKAVMGIRVSEEEEYEGVDLAECGLEAYPEFSVAKK